MKIVKWGLFFILSFLVSWAIIATLSQPLFTLAVPVRFVTYESPVFPIYYYVIAAFLLGLGIGLAIALYNYVIVKKESFKRGREIHKLEGQIEDCEENEVRREQDAAEEEPIPDDPEHAGEILGDGDSEDETNEDPLYRKEEE